MLLNLQLVMANTPAVPTTSILLKYKYVILERGVLPLSPPLPGYPLASLKDIGHHNIYTPADHFSRGEESSQGMI